MLRTFMCILWLLLPTNIHLQIDINSRRIFGYYSIVHVLRFEPVTKNNCLKKNKPLPSTNMSKNPSSISLKPSGQSTALQIHFTGPYSHFVGTLATFAQCSLTNCSSTCNGTGVRFRSRCVFNCRCKKIFKRWRRLGDCTMSEADLTKVDYSMY